MCSALAAALRALADRIDPPAPRPTTIAPFADDPWALVDEEALVRADDEIRRREADASRVLGARVNFVRGPSLEQLIAEGLLSPPAAGDVVADTQPTTGGGGA